MQVIVPMAGSNVFYGEKPDSIPKPLYEISGRAMIDWSISALNSLDDNMKFVFILREADCLGFQLDKVLRLICGDHCDIIITKSGTDGALCSCLMAIDSLTLSEPLVIANFDQYFQCDLKSCIHAKSHDALVLTSKSVHPRWCYIERDANSKIIQFHEKTPVSNEVVAGFYYFHYASTFIDAAKNAMRSKRLVDGSYYVSAALNQIILDGGAIGSHVLNQSEYRYFFQREHILKIDDNDEV